MNLIPIDELVEVWVETHKEILAIRAAREKMPPDPWWREACQYLRPTPEDDQILNDEEEKR